MQTQEYALNVVNCSQNQKCELSLKALKRCSSESVVTPSQIPPLWERNKTEAGPRSKEQVLGQSRTLGEGMGLPSVAIEVACHCTWHHADTLPPVYFLSSNSSQVLCPLQTAKPHSLPSILCSLGSAGIVRET